MQAPTAGSTRFSREYLRERSKHLFGNRDRLEVAAAIAQSSGALVNATELSQALDGLPSNRVRAQLIAMANADLLGALPREGAGPSWYVRKPSSFWESCLKLCEPEGDSDGR